MAKMHIRERPEAKIQKAIIGMLMMKGWHVMPTHGNMFQSGFPDLFTCHTRYGTRWVEVKNPDKYSFTSAQLENFPKMAANGANVWILTAADETNYNRLFGPANWHMYLWKGNK